MTRTKRVLTFASVVAATVVGLAGPASADSGINVTVSTSVQSAHAVVQGNAGWSGGTHPTIDSVTISVSPAGGQPSSTSASTTWCSGSSCGGESTGFSWSTPNLSYNGAYQVTVSVAGSQHPGFLESCDGSCSQTSQATTTFTIEVAPAAPKSLAATVDAPSRAVTLSWARNTEPDMVGYAVYRKGPADAGYQPLAQVAQPPPNQRVTYADSTTANAGGSYSYQVVALRKGADSRSFMESSPSTVAATVDAPPTAGGSGSGSGGTSGSGGGGGQTVGAPGRPPILTSGGRVDAASFSVLQSQVKIPANQSASTATTIEPDTGFNENLPFRKATTATTKTPDSDGASFPSIVHTAASDNRKAVLVSLAIAAIVFALAFHVRYLMRRIDQVAG